MLVRKTFPLAALLFVLGYALPTGADAQCRDCAYSTVLGMHMTVESAKIVKGVGGTFHDGSWVTGTCSGHGHYVEDNSCFRPAGLERKTREDLARWADLSANDVRLLTQRHPGVLVVDRPRAALQVLDCQGRVVANLPLASHQLPVA